MASRAIITVLVMLTLGAALNIIVAWACVLATDSRVFDARVLGQLRAAEFERADRERAAGEGGEGVEGGDANAEARYLALLFESPGTRVLMMDGVNTGALQRQRMNQHDAGWPLLALRANQFRGANGVLEITGGVKAGFLATQYPALPVTAVAPPTAQAALPTMPAPAMLAMPRPQQRLDRILPFLPIWPAFAINSIVFGALAWLVWMLCVMMMRAQRRWRGLCGRCAYPIGVSPVCTECGRRVRPVAKIPA
jgi:hypothetical protein